MTRLVSWIAALSGLLAAAPALADTVLNGVTTTQLSEKPQPTTVYLTSDKARMVTGGQDTIYRGDLGKVWTVQLQRNAYYEFTPGEMAEMRARAEAARAQAMKMVEQRLASLPPEQREAVKRALASQMPAAATGEPNVTYRLIAAGRKVGPWRCDEYEALAEGKRVTAMCIAPLAELGLTADDLKVVDRMSSLLATAAGADPRGGFYGLETVRRITGHEGLPVRSETYSGDQEVYSFELKSIDRGRIPPGTFDLPPGLEKRSLVQDITPQPRQR